MGYFRFILALAVCANHLWVIGGVGRYAVFSFYILSGYLMTTIITERYGTSLAGIKKYAINRLLRIYPLYLIAFLFSLLALTMLGTNGVRHIDSNLSIPSGFASWFMNTTLLGLDFSIKERTIPPGWTLFVELFFYVFIPIAVRFGKKFISAWLAVSIAYHILMIIFADKPMLDWDARYGTVMAGSLGFSVGCFFRYNALAWVKSKTVFSLAMLTLIAGYTITSLWFLSGPSVAQLNIISVLFFYTNMISSVIVIANIFNVKQGVLGKTLGDFSYPFYLFHLPVGFILYKLLATPPGSIELFLTGSLATIIVCLLLRKLDKLINKVRDRVKAS